VTDFCWRCGECCRTQPEGITISEQEKIELESFGKEIFMELILDDMNGKRYLWHFNVCPFLVNDRCSIYESRPTMCRMYHCGRISQGDSKIPTIAGIIEIMKENPEYEAYRRQIEDEAVLYGNAHGWHWRKV
jgi:Fe-S-cluster containining protein